MCWLTHIYLLSASENLRIVVQIFSGINGMGGGVLLTPSLWSRWGGGAPKNGDTASSPLWLDRLIGDTNERFRCYIIIINGEEVWARKTLLSLVDPGSTTSYIFPLLTLQEVGRIEFKAQHHDGCLSRPYFPSLSKGVTAS